MEQKTVGDSLENNTLNSVIEEVGTSHENEDNVSVTSKEICTQKLDIHSSERQNDNLISNELLFCLSRRNDNSLLETVNIEDNSLLNPEISSVPIVPLKHLPLPITNQPLRIWSNSSSPTSLNIIPPNQPQSLFLQALTKLNESSLSLAVAVKRNDTAHFRVKVTSDITNSPELSPPDSLTSAPPSYSFVLRQMASRRRPRLMGTFIPSPSFIQHTPPPNYATAFDIYVDNPLPPPSTRVYNFGFTPIPVVCPECGYTGMSVVASKITLCTHICAIILCLLCCWVCAPLPYVLRSCKDVYHYCRNCRNFLGVYCPTNPESTYT